MASLHGQCAGLFQPGNEEVISPSAATVGVQDVMTHTCLFPALGGEPHTMDLQLDCEKTSFRSAHTRLHSSARDTADTTETEREEEGMGRQLSPKQLT